MMRKKLSHALSLAALAWLLVSPAWAQTGLPTYNGCPMEGDARSQAVRALNRLKNRCTAPTPEQINPKITLAPILAPGDDIGRWKVSQGATITGYVYDVKPGGIETVNCHAQSLADRDTHIELVSDPNDSAPSRRVIVGVTPRGRTIIASQDVDWSTGNLRRTLLGRRVTVTGWMLFDAQHANAAQNTNPGDTNSWRATAWEIHPVRDIQVVPAPVNGQKAQQQPRSAVDSQKTPKPPVAPTNSRPGLVKAKGSPSKLSVVEAPTLIVDPACNTYDGGSVILQLRNEGSQPEELSLSAGPLLNKSTNKSLDAEIFLTPVTSLTGKEKAKNTAVAPGKFQFVRVDVKNVLEEGYWDAEIRNLGAKIGTFKVVRPQVPFSVSLDDSNLFLQRGRKGFLLLKNDDAAAYPVTWELLLPGKKRQAGPDTGRKSKAAAGPDFTLPAGGTTYLAFDPPGGWFPWKSIVKDEVVDGQLILRLRRLNGAAEGCAPASDAPTKILKVKAHLAFVSTGWQEAAQTVLLLVLLALGAAFSFLVNLVLPNQRRRRSVSQLLKTIQLKIDALPTALASRLRVLAGIEKGSLAEGAGLPLWSLNTREQLAVVQDAAGRLERRVGLLEKLGSDRTQFETLRAKGAPPTLIDEIDQLFEHTVEILSELGTSETSLTAAQANITEIEKRLANLENKDQSNPDFAHMLAQGAVWLKEEFLGDKWETSPDPKNGAAGRYPAYDRMCQALPGLFDLLLRVPNEPEKIEPRGYARWDTVVYKLTQIWRYVMWREAGDRVKAKQYTDVELGKLEHELVEGLLLFGWEGLDSARRLVKEMYENIFPKDIAEQIRRNKVRIRIDRSEVRQLAPTRFYLEFYDPAYNTAEAREEWTCVWDFGHPAIPEARHTQNMIEYGWSVTHYFPEKKSYAVKVNFLRHKGGPQDDETDKQLTVSRTFEVGPPKLAIAKTSKKFEAFQVVVAILPALLALVAGAKDQLLKLDLLPALIAIFLIGFGSDQIKSLLTQQTK